MPRKPNYRIERAERDRAKKAKKDEKIKQQQERAALRKAGDGGEDAPEADSAVNSGADPAAEDGERPSEPKLPAGW
ncbi:MAG: hypothetical protein WB678_02880 [Stellaceae bacterium]